MEKMNSYDQEKDLSTWEEPKIVELGIHETAGTGGIFGDNQSALIGGGATS